MIKNKWNCFSLPFVCRFIPTWWGRIMQLPLDGSKRHRIWDDRRLEVMLVFMVVSLQLKFHQVRVEEKVGDTFLLQTTQDPAGLSKCQQEFPFSSLFFGGQGQFKVLPEKLPFHLYLLKGGGKIQTFLKVKAWVEKMFTITHLTRILMRSNRWKTLDVWYAF